MAVEKGACPGNDETKYGDGLTPNQTYKADVDELVKHKERQDWKGLRKQLKETGIRNSTLMALMPAETSAQISNSTNGIEPPRSFVSVKQSKHGVLKQVVPQYAKLKNKYDLLWDQASPEGYLKIMAVLQKYIDQGISVNTSYNPEHFEDEKIPMSVLLQHIIMFYNMVASSYTTTIHMMDKARLTLTRKNLVRMLKPTLSRQLMMTKIATVVRFKE